MTGNNIAVAVCVVGGATTLVLGDNSAAPAAPAPVAPASAPVPAAVAPAAAAETVAMETVATADIVKLV